MSSRTPSGDDQAAASALPEMPDIADTLVLVRHAQQGDRDAMNRLFERYYDRVHRIVRIRMGAKLRGVLDSTDIVQETCAVASRKLAQFEPRDHASLIQWLARIAEHQIHDEVDRMNAKKRDRGLEVPLDRAGRAAQDTHTGFQVSDHGASPTSIVANNELKEIYDACVEALPDDQRELILAREYANASWETICRDLKKSNVHATQEAYRRAQVKLSTLLRQRMRR